MGCDTKRKKLTKNTNHSSGCCFLSIYRLSSSCTSSYLKLIPLFFNIRVQTCQGACFLKVQKITPIPLARCGCRMLWFGALGSAGERSSVEIYCLEHSLTRMLADGLMLDKALLFPLYTRWLRVTVLAWQVQLGTLPHRAQKPCALQKAGRGGVQPSGSRKFPYISGSFTLKTASGVDRIRMGRTLVTIPPFHTENPPEGKKKKKKRELIYIKLSSS